MTPRYRRRPLKEAQTLGRLGILTNEVVTVTVSTVDGTPLESISTDIFEDAIAAQGLDDAILDMAEGARRCSVVNLTPFHCSNSIKLGRSRTAPRRRHGRQ